MSDHHAQFLNMENQHSSLKFNTTEQMFRDFQEIEKNKNIIGSLIESVDWVTVLHFSHNHVDLSSELCLKKGKK